MSEGTIIQRGFGQVPNGMSVDGVPAAAGTIFDRGFGGTPPQHITMYGDGWNRSWNIPGRVDDHTTIHASGRIIQHP